VTHDPNDDDDDDDDDVQLWVDWCAQRESIFTPKTTIMSFKTCNIDQ